MRYEYNSPDGLNKFRLIGVILYNCESCIKLLNKWQAKIITIGQRKKSNKQYYGFWKVKQYTATEIK